LWFKSKDKRVRNIKSKNKGFTLVELIITLLIGSLLLAWGVPEYRELKARRMVTDITNDIVTSFTQARAEAVRYGNNVEVSPNGTWQDGWTITSIGVDGNDDEILAVQDPIDTVVEIAQTGALNGNVVFNSIGGLEGGLVGEFTLKHTVSEISRSVVIGLSGSARVQK
jgi:type IV fimbrial biogenesis protein FimT